MIDDEGLEGKNPVLIDLNAKNLDFQFLTERVEVIKDKAYTTNTDRLLEELFTILYEIKDDDTLIMDSVYNYNGFSKSHWED